MKSSCDPNTLLASVPSVIEISRIPPIARKIPSIFFLLFQRIFFSSNQTSPFLDPMKRLSNRTNSIIRFLFYYLDFFFLIIRKKPIFRNLIFFLICTKLAGGFVGVSQQYFCSLVCPTAVNVSENTMDFEQRRHKSQHVFLTRSYARSRADMDPHTDNWPMRRKQTQDLRTTRVYIASFITKMSCLFFIRLFAFKKFHHKFQTSKTIHGIDKFDSFTDKNIDWFFRNSRKVHFDRSVFPLSKQNKHFSEYILQILQRNSFLFFCELQWAQKFR